MFDIAMKMMMMMMMMKLWNRTQKWVDFQVLGFLMCRWIDVGLKSELDLDVPRRAHEPLQVNGCCVQVQALLLRRLWHIDGRDNVAYTTAETTCINWWARVHEWVSEWVGEWVDGQKIATQNLYSSQNCRCPRHHLLACSFESLIQIVTDTKVINKLIV